MPVIQQAACPECRHCGQYLVRMSGAWAVAEPDPRDRRRPAVSPYCLPNGNGAHVPAAS